MASFNRVILVGNLTRDVDVRYTPQGTAVTDIGLAVNDRIKKQGEWVDETTFVDVTMWSRTAEIAGEYLSKGSPVLIEGRLRYETWEQEGQKRSKLKVVCERMQMLGSRGGGGGGQSRPSNQQNSNQQNNQNSNNVSEAQPSYSSGQQQQTSSVPPEDEVPF